MPKNWQNNQSCSLTDFTLISDESIGAGAYVPIHLILTFSIIKARMWQTLVKVCNHHKQILYVIQICSEITRGKVLNGELYAQRLQKLIYLHLSTDHMSCTLKINLPWNSHVWKIDSLSLLLSSLPHIYGDVCVHAICMRTHILTQTIKIVISQLQPTFTFWEYNTWPITSTWAPLPHVLCAHRRKLMSHVFTLVIFFPDAVLQLHTGDCIRDIRCTITITFIWFKHTILTHELI